MHRISSGMELHSLKITWKEPTMPLTGGDGLSLPPLAHGSHHHKTREIPGLSPETIQQPGSHTGPATHSGSRIHERMSRIMIDLLRVKGTNDAHFIGHGTQTGKQLTEMLTGLSVLFESMLRGETLERPALELGNGLSLGQAFRHAFTISLHQLFLVIKSLEMRRATGHAEVDDTSCTWSLMEGPRSPLFPGLSS